jgi:hypothetical protein
LDDEIGFLPPDIEFQALGPGDKGVKQDSTPSTRVLLDWSVLPCADEVLRVLCGAADEYVLLLLLLLFLKCCKRVGYVTRYCGV